MIQHYFLTYVFFGIPANALNQSRVFICYIGQSQHWVTKFIMIFLAVKELQKTRA